MELSIIFEDDTIVVINKPAGVMTHPDGKTTDDTVSDWFASSYPASKEVGETQRLQDGTEIRRPGVVHRLDRETSGVLVLAKTQEAHEHLKLAFQNHEVKKTYIAFTYGVPKERKGTIDFAIGRSRQDFRLRSAQPKAKGTLREAITHYEILTDNGTHSLMKIQPMTGRTHQIRVHMKAIHHPIVCDPLYAPNRACDLHFDRLGLHAYSLEIPMMGGETKVFNAPVPEAFKEAVSSFPNAEAIIALV